VATRPIAKGSAETLAAQMTFKQAKTCRPRVFTQDQKLLSPIFWQFPHDQIITNARVRIGDHPNILIAA